MIRVHVQTCTVLCTCLTCTNIFLNMSQTCTMSKMYMFKHVQIRWCTCLMYMLNMYNHCTCLVAPNMYKKHVHSGNLYMFVTCLTCTPNMYIHFCRQMHVFGKMYIFAVHVHGCAEILFFKLNSRLGQIPAATRFILTQSCVKYHNFSS